MSQLTLTYFDLRSDDAAPAAPVLVLPDLGGHYSLQLLANVSTKLRILRVGDTHPVIPPEERTHYLPHPSAHSTHALHVPESWKKPHLSVALITTKAIPKHLVLLVATPQPVASLKELTALVNGKDTATHRLLCFLWVQDSTPTLPAVADMPAAA